MSTEPATLTPAPSIKVGDKILVFGPGPGDLVGRYILSPVLLEAIVTDVVVEKDMVALWVDFVSDTEPVSGTFLTCYPSQLIPVVGPTKPLDRCAQINVAGASFWKTVDTGLVKSYS